MTRTMSSKRIGGLCFAAGVFLPVLLIVLGEVVLPTVFRNTMHRKLVLDSQSEVDEWVDKDGGYRTNNSITFIFFNLTNAKEMQTQFPAPKPAFETVSVECIESIQKFDGTSKDDGNAYKFHEWSRFSLLNEADAHLEIVNINPAYLGGIFTLAPSEKAAFAGLSNVVLGTVFDILTSFGAGILALDPLPATVQKSLAESWANTSITTAAEFGIVQFASNIHMNLAVSAQSNPPAGCAATSCVGSPYVSVSANPILQSSGVCTPLELNTYMNDLTGGPFTSGGPIAYLLATQELVFVSFSMSYTEATAFFKTFTGTMGGYATPLILGQMLRAYSAFVAAGDSAGAAATAANIFSQFGTTFGTLTVHAAPGVDVERCTSTADLGACPALALAYAIYLTSYLPEKFFVGCGLLGCADNSCMNDDGTSTMNSGLFVRHTVKEMLHGWDDPLFAVVPQSAFPPGAPTSYPGLLKPYTAQARTLNDLRADFTAGTYMKEDLSSEHYSGKDSIDNVGVWIASQGSTISVVGNSNYTGWGTAGRPDEPFSTTGLTFLKQQRPKTEIMSPWSMVSNSYASKPNFGSGIDFYLAQAVRPVYFNCNPNPDVILRVHRNPTNMSIVIPFNSGSVDDCDFHDVKGIKTLKFSVTPTMYFTTLDGVSSYACRGTTSARYASLMKTTTGPTCDWLMRHAGVLNLEVARGAPFALTAGYLGHTGSLLRQTVSITEVNSSTEIYYSKANDEILIFYDPITGRALKGLENLQANWYVEATLLDSLRYANIFTADTDNDDTFVWPYIFVRRDLEIGNDNASKLRSAYQTPFIIGVVLDIFGILLFVTFFSIGTVYCLKKPTEAPEKPKTTIANVVIAAPTSATTSRSASIKMVEAWGV